MKQIEVRREKHQWSFFKFGEHAPYDLIVDEIVEAYEQIDHHQSIPTLGEIIDSLETVFLLSATDYQQYIMNPVENIEFKLGYEELSKTAFERPVGNEEKIEVAGEMLGRQMDVTHMRKLFNQDVRVLLSDYLNLSFIDVGSSTLAAVKYMNAGGWERESDVINPPIKGVW